MVRPNSALPPAPIISTLDDILDKAIAATDADFGNVQVVHRRDGTLRIVAQRGFGRPFLEFFRVVKTDKSACSAALKSHHRVVVTNVMRSNRYTEPARKIMLEAEARSCQSTPIVGSDGTILGIISTHFRVPHRCTEKQLKTIDRLATEASEVLTECQPASRVLNMVSAIIEELHDQSRTKSRTSPR